MIIQHPTSADTSAQMENMVLLTFYGDAVHSPGDGWLRCSTGPTDQHSALSWSQNKVPGGAADPIRSGWK